MPSTHKTAPSAPTCKLILTRCVLPSKTPPQRNCLRRASAAYGCCAPYKTAHRRKLPPRQCVCRCPPFVKARLFARICYVEKRKSACFSRANPILPPAGGFVGDAQSALQRLAVQRGTVYFYRHGIGRRQGGADRGERGGFPRLRFLCGAKAPRRRAVVCRTNRAFTRRRGVFDTIQRLYRGAASVPCRESVFAAMGIARFYGLACRRAVADLRRALRQYFSERHPIKYSKSTQSD